MSRAIVDSLSPDNKNMKGLIVKTVSTPSEARITVNYDGRIETFISTMEDFLRCIQAAHATIERITK
jgi:hypothetical protein